MPSTTYRFLAASIIFLAAAFPAAAQADKIVHVDLAYRAPGNGPAPNFSPYGTQVKLADVAADATLPEGATRPARTGELQIGPARNSWIKILVTADAAHPRDLCLLYIDRNRNGLFTDDGPPLTAAPSQNEKTKAWWSSFSHAGLSIPYGSATEPYLVDFWAVREGEDTPSVIRYSVRSWRAGTVAVNGAQALVAMMDSNNDALFTDRDTWSVLAASEPDSARRVLSIQEARPTSRLMFLTTGEAAESRKELVLEFRSVSPDGRSLTFAVVDRPVTKAQDRAPDDTLAAERSRPRASKPFPWIDAGLDRGIAEARESGRKVILDFWTSWCGPCHSLDEWIWSDAEVAAALNAGYVGVKFDGDLAKEMVRKFHVEGYPTLIVLDSSGKELKRFGYQSSKQMLEMLAR